MTVDYSCVLYIQTLQRFGPDLSAVSNWSVIGQFSSVGSLGNSVDAWMTGELLDSLSAGKGISNKAKLQLVSSLNCSFLIISS